ncbi:hypothetical protein [Geomesophilobacter sediminis]|uniref:Outer membrane protein beta-barrel domain-containing protein n=1 Tax=Geomesophilobacter sediminis TaxID=2798584 RepID=A0A8J7M0V7_9BACT|nr:hypothetical protein [Geomesophilobacter sediminis]MBJ6726519.1 hypothetical protein [Geomesophilobacter sediminis]
MRLAVFTLCFLLAGVDLLDAAEFSSTPYLAGQYFTWREYEGGGGRRILKESGPLAAGGVKVDQRTDYWHLQEHLQIFGGAVGYKGETQAGVPISLNVDYVGYDASMLSGGRLPTRVGSFEPFAGIGYRWWARNLHDTRTSSGTPVYGYTERWENWYAKIGGRWDGSIAPAAKLYLEGGAKNPFFVANRVNFTGVGDVTFRPVGRWAPFGEAGVSWGRWQLTASYEGFRFSQSPLTSVRTSTGTSIYLQPDSSSDIWGLQLGYRFP